MSIVWPIVDMRFIFSFFSGFLTPNSWMFNGSEKSCFSSSFYSRENYLTP
jgi:hypothetical protein